MKWHTLESSQDEYDNSLGFKFAGQKAYEGMMVDRGENRISLIAHDIIEHQNGIAAIGPIWDELQAMGGVWHTRGRWGMIEGRATQHEQIASDIVRMGADMSYGWREFDQMGHVPEKTKAHECDDDFLEIIEIARSQLPRELPDDHELNIGQYLSEALDHMRIGYRKAERRFGKYRFASSNQFAAITDAIREATHWIDYEGQIFRLGWGDGKAVVHPVYDESAYY